MNLLNRVAHMDIFDLCDCLDDDSVDMILCDLPYGITACNWDAVIPFEPMWECFKRIIKPRGAIVLTASQPFTSQLVMSNLDMFKYEWIWGKSMGTDFIRSSLKPLAKHENVLIFSDGNVANCSDNNMFYYPQKAKGEPFKKKQVSLFRDGVVGARPSHKKYLGSIQDNKGTRFPTSVISYSNDNYKSKHPTQKPVALFEYLIRTYTQPGDVVFDPVVGSGTTALAARNTGRNYIVGDYTQEYVEIARKRIAAPYTLPMFEEATTPETAQQLEMEI